MFLLLYHPIPAWQTTGNVCLLISYGLAPVAYGLLVWLLLRLIQLYARHRSARTLAIGSAIACWSVGGILLLDAATWLPIHAARVLEQLGLYDPPEGYFLPAPYHTILGWLAPPIHYATRVLLLGCVAFLVSYGIRFPRAVRA